MAAALSEALQVVAVTCETAAPFKVVVAPDSLLPVTVTPAASAALMMSLPATALMTGAVGAIVSTLMACVAVVVLPAASVDTAVRVSAPSPKAVMAAALSTALQVVAVTVAATPFNVTVEPASVVPVTVTVASLSEMLMLSLLATMSMTGAVGATVSTVILRVLVAVLPAASVATAVRVSAP